jgi:hypothetical protein
MRELLGRIARGWRRRAPLYLLVAAMAVLIVGYLRRQPVDAQVRYRYGRYAAGLRWARMAYYRDDEVALRVRFRYGDTPAPSTQIHRVRLPAGDYEVAIELGRREAGQTGSVGGVEGGEQRVVARLRRLLPLHGPGVVDLFVDPSSDNE